MSTDPVLAARVLPAGTDGYHVPLYFAAKGGLLYLRGNRAPYFSLTYTQHRSGNPAQCQSGGAGHGRILRYFPQFADLAALHLSDIDGVPMHAEANGWYWLAGALGGAGERYHGGNGKQQHWRRADGSKAIDSGEPGAIFDGYREPTPDECLETFAELLRISLDDAANLRDEARDEAANNPDGWQAARAAFGLRVDDMRPRWKSEADAAIAKHHLKVYGDPWPTPQAAA